MSTYQLVLAVTLTAVINPNQDSTQATYEELHTVLVNYPQGSEIASLLKKNVGTIQITSTSLPTENNKINQAAMQNLVTNINQALSTSHSLTRATWATIKFIGDIRSYSATQSIVDQRTLVDIGLEKYMLPNNQDTEHKFVDFNWRDFTVYRPLVLSYTDNKTGTNKTMNVNYMSGLLNSLIPGFMDAFKRAGATAQAISLLERPVLDYSKLSTSMDRWYVLFDPAASLVETQGYGYKGEENGARVDTIYSLGEGSLREGVHEETTQSYSFGGGANAYSLILTVPPPNARIDVLGYSKMTVSPNGDSVAVISKQNEGGSSYAGNFPLVVLASLGGVMGGITGFVLIKGRK
ncbi:MAG TPA: hypothetical protein VJ729_04570 [Nitrososphaeraceae archaeon]|nr:hypothetical protein [Nitrososphaeraceae archaeon]